MPQPKLVGEWKFFIS